MKTILAIYLSFVLSSCSAVKSFPKGERADLLDKSFVSHLIKNSVAIKFSCGLTGVGQLGSGVVLRHSKGKTIVATAKHVTDIAEEHKCDLIVEGHSGKSGFGTVLASDDATDVAIVEVDELVGVPAPTYSKPYAGQSISCVGWPVIPYKGLSKLSVTRGYISTAGVGGYLRVSADLYFGNSGGACFSRSGKVVGIVSHFMVGSVFLGTRVPMPGQYYISNSNNLKKLLAKANIQ